MLFRLVAIAGAAACSLAAADETARRVDEIFQEWNKPGAPGASVAVIRNGEIVLQKGYGSANLEYPIPIAAGTVFHVASVTKQFTAMALVLLEREGKLSLEDDVRKYLPELPDYGNTVTIRHLLQHTGGIRDQWQTLALAGWRLDDVITQKQILRMLFRQKELNFTPGSEHLYSNGGYTLAAEIAARVAGKPFPQVCQERIFKPLGMRSTHMHDDHRRVVLNRAYSYSKTNDGYEASPLNYANAGATSLFTTAPDLVRWLDNFRDPKVGGRESMDRLQQRAVLAGGRTIDYALGVSIGKLRGVPVVQHSGGDAGYRSHVLWLPDQRIGVAVLGNAGNFSPGAIAGRVAAVYAGGALEPEKQASKPVRQYVEVDAATVQRYLGTYQLEGGLVIQFEARNGRLFGAPPGESMDELKPLAANRFFAERPDAEVEFTPAPDGGMRLALKQRQATLKGQRLTFSSSTPFDPAAYAGRYWSEELETQYTLLARDGKLFADHARHGEFPLTRTAGDRFRGTQWFFREVEFTRDATGLVTGMKVGGGRVRGVTFVRIGGPAGSRP